VPAGYRSDVKSDSAVQAEARSPSPA
jgi:hypothetical protein